MPEMSFEKNLHMIGKPTSRPVPRLLVESLSVGEVKREVNFFIINGTKRFPHKVEGWIDSVRPASVEAERCLSAAGFFATKLKIAHGRGAALCIAGAEGIFQR